MSHALDDGPVLTGDLDRTDVEDAKVLDGLRQAIEDSRRQKPRDRECQSERATQRTVSSVEFMFAALGRSLALERPAIVRLTSEVERLLAS